MSARIKYNGLLIFKIVLWTLMAVTLFILGILMGVSNILTPERLTPITEKLATRSLQNCEVHIKSVNLTVMRTFPFVHADIEKLYIISTVRDKIDVQQPRVLPEYTDTLLAVDRFEGGMNIMKLLSNKLSLSDVIIDNPSANLVVLDAHTTNFDIIPPGEGSSEPFDWNNLPGISLKRFAIINPGKLRYYNYVNDTEITARFSKVELDGSNQPLYNLAFDGEVIPPTEFYETFNLYDLRFGLNGSLDWSQKEPNILRLADFELLLSLINCKINTEVDFKKGIHFNRLDAYFSPIALNDIVALLKSGIARKHGVPELKDISTNAKILFTFHLDEPWNAASDTLAPFTLNATVEPCYFQGYGAECDNFSASLEYKQLKPWVVKKGLPDAQAIIYIPPTEAKWDNFDAKRLEVDMSLTLPDGDINMAEIDIRKFDLMGPATDIKLSGLVSNIFKDVSFRVKIDTDTDLRALPNIVLQKLRGNISGRIKAHVDLDGSKSMFTPEDFHRLYINGDLDLDKVYWIASDTIDMFDIHKAKIHFGSSENISNGNHHIDSLMRFSLNIDSALILHDNISMNLKRLDLNLAAQNKSESLKKGKINPMGGKLTLGAFNMLVTTDSTVVRVRDLKGTTVIKAYNNNVRIPQFIFDLDIKRIATGNKETRFLINNAHTHINARRVPQGRQAKRIAQVADSIQQVYPNMPPDSVIYYALQIHRSRPKSRYTRVHEEFEKDDSIDVIDWGASKLFKRMLTWWTFEGSLTSKRAGLFTPHMPVRNRVRDIDITFNNDTVNIKNLQYKMGSSDFTINGIVTNMRKAFTDPLHRSPLRANFEMLSDTVDVNQITDIFVRASSLAALSDDKKNYSLSELMDDEVELEKAIADMTANAPDTVMPILIPENIDAQFRLKANHVLYSDFQLDNMSGNILAYSGALNLRNLKAESTVGKIDISALYSGLHPNDLRFGFDLKLTDFHLQRFLKLVPAVDSLLPIMRDLNGIISADIAATSDVDNHMNLVIPSLDAAIQLRGDSLVVLTPDKFKMVSKWLVFKDKSRNLIDSVDVQVTIADNHVNVYPFIFNFDRYKIGVQGYNDFNMNFNYHIAVLKSPIPFKFGINVSGDREKHKIRLGGANFNENQIRRVAIVDTTRINLMDEINNVFLRGARDARLAKLKMDTEPLAAKINLEVDSLTHADSLQYIKEGLIDAPEGFYDQQDNNKRTGENKKKHKKSLLPFIPLFATLTNERYQIRRKKYYDKRRSA